MPLERNRKAPVFFVPFALAVLLVGCGGGGAERGEGSGEDRPAPPVEAVAARAGALPEILRLEGSVRAASQVEVRAEIEAPVAEVLVASGEAVRRGQTLVRLKDDSLAEQVRQAEAAVRLAEATAAATRARVDEVAAREVRARALAEQGLVSAVEAETLAAQLAAARANALEAEARIDRERATLDERRADLARAAIRSPVDGRVGLVRVERGQLVDPGALLFLVGDLDRLIVELPLAEAQLARAAVGQRLEIFARALGPRPVEARLARISPFLAAGSFSTVAEADLANPDGRIAPGTFVTADLFVGERERATLVPTSALFEDPVSGSFSLFVVEAAAGPALAAAESLGETPVAVERRPVAPLAEGRGMVAVTGVEEGEWVVTVGQHLLSADGRGRARVRPTSWERVVELQGLQREDVLAGFLAKQQRLAREAGGAPVPQEATAGGGPR